MRIHVPRAGSCTRAVMARDRETDTGATAASENPGAMYEYLLQHERFSTCVTSSSVTIIVFVLMVDVVLAHAR